MRRIATACWLSLAAACGTGPGGGQEPEPVGVPTTVEILDQHFVRFEGRRIPLEAFLLEMRQRVRAAGGAFERYPAVTVTAVTEAGDLTELVGRIVEELRRAGVRSVKLGDA